MVGILGIWNDCAVGKIETYEAWYHGEHLADRVGISGFRFGRRHEAIMGSPHYFTYYETDSVEVLFSEQYLKQLDHPSPLTQEVMDGVFINATRTVCERATRVGAGRGGYVVVGRTKTNLTQVDWNPMLSSLMPKPGVLSLELWRKAKISNGNNEARAEEQIRGPDETIMGAFIVHTARECDARRIYGIVSPNHNGDIGIYHLVSELDHSNLDSPST